MRLWALSIFNDLDPFVLAPWAFKSAPIVIWLVIRFNRNEPHLRVRKHHSKGGSLSVGAE